ncbi:ferredoxin-fold anticodon-binding domain-containing protein 1 homolog [Uloborus diversus]|uniref:ferredoxin-fold anticodon-binding domain-containing protein 1 homolog n=1 Tax=Uloborus diversus TaxID=327109 RepID=UPI00240A5F80|nr:ferredoxin-fold anticodon-binding domain-containing protein 1 homolog [Uloborus diversus]
MASQLKKEAVLFVGEGDFSFAASYIACDAGLNEEIYATCLNGLEQTENIQKIQEFGGHVYTDVDATSLHCHPLLKYIYFTKIIFNFPHVKKKMNIRDNRKLLQEFFCSARKQLKENGKIIVTLCQGQGGTEFEFVKREWCNTWQICNMAASASLILVQVLPFDPNNFLNYKCTGYRGLNKPFNISGALTHFFCLAPGAELEVREIKIEEDIEKYYLQNCKELFLKFSMNMDGPFSPSNKIISFLMKMVSQNLVFSPETTVSTLLTCTDFVSVGETSVSQVQKCAKVASSNICTSCLKCLAELYVQNGYFDTQAISSYICSICCSKYFDVFKLPFYKSVTYFSRSKNSLFTFYNLIKEQLKKLFDPHLNDGVYKDQKSAHELHSNRTIEAPFKYVLEDMLVKQIVTVYASYSLKKYNGLTFYCDINIIDSNLCQAAECSNITSVEIGSIFLFEHKLLSKFWCFNLNIDLIACLKFNILDERMLFYEGSYFTCTFNKISQLIYRCKSISPPIFVHDTSFWVEDDFCERKLLLLIRSISHLLIKKAVLVDSYYQESEKRFSKCYRFHYQSCNNALSKEKANDIHTKIIRKALSRVLKLSLR